MKGIIFIGGKLAIICAVAAIVLGFTNSVTEPAIELNKKRELERALNTVVKQGTAGDEVPVEEHRIVRGYYPVSSDDGEIIGYALRLVGMGYGGDMNMLANFHTSGEVLAVVLMDNLETPGLGKKAEKPEYMEKFIGTGTPDRKVPTRKDNLSQYQADAITGATVTFIGVAKALEAGSSFIQNEGGLK